MITSSSIHRVIPLYTLEVYTVGGTWSQTISNEAMQTVFFTDESRTVDVVYTDVVGNASSTLVFLRGIGLGWLAYGLERDISRVKVAVDCDSR